MSKQKLRKRNKKQNYKLGKPDNVILIFTIIFALFGVVMIFNASSFKANIIFQDQFHFLELQLLWLTLGTIAMFLIIYSDYHIITLLSIPGMLIGIGLLVAVLIFSDPINGSRRWFSIQGIPIQPAELIKPILILFLSFLLSHTIKSTSSTKKIRKNFYKSIGLFLGTIGITLLLILLEPDLGTTMVLGTTSFAIFYLAGESKQHKKATIATMALFLLLAVIAAILEQYRLKRIMTFFSLLFTGKVSNPQSDGYQMQQILIGIGSGGFWGKGFGQSRQRYGFLVENTAFTDSIFAIVLEELGIIGGLVILGSWMLFLRRGFTIALNAPDKLGKLVSTGITIWLSFQAIFNIAATVGLIPLTGIPLPLMTYGGSNTLVTMVGIGILLNISRWKKKSF